MYAKTSRNGLRFLAHAPGAPTCSLGLESVAHHLLKLELANAARDAGAHAELEARGPDGTWRADVPATDPTEAWKTALEAQLAPITDADITARTEKMRADGVTSIWFNDRPRPPWLGSVPSVTRRARPSKSLRRAGRLRADPDVDGAAVEVDRPAVGIALTLVVAHPLQAISLLLPVAGARK